MVVRGRLRDRGFDEELGFELTVAFTLSFVLTVLLVIFITPLHELLHVLGAYLEGGVVKDVVWIDLGAWFETYIHPIVAVNGELGYTSAVLPSNSLFGGFVFYFLPYIVMLPLSVFLMLGDNTRYFLGGNGISNLWRLVGGPMFILNFGAFWTDLALFMGVREGVIPIPAVVWQLLYLGVIVMGVVGSTVWIYFVRDS